MGFCRSCGDIVVAERCRKCGGLAVAASVKFETKEGVRDRWSKTYTAPSSSDAVAPAPAKRNISPVRASSPIKEATRPSTPPSAPSYTKPLNSSPSTSAVKTPSRFPRPMGGYGAASTPSPTSTNTTLNRMSAHINASTAPRPPSPLKNHTTGTPDYSNDITVVKSHVTGALVKVHGSILERPESLANFACYECLLKFPPDETIYPSPTDEGKFLCRECFGAHDEAVRGVCESCHKPVYALAKEEGGKPIENAGRIWHGACFRCEACGLDIRRKPMVDILGRPCCEDCFDECLKLGEPSPSSPVSKSAGTPKRGRTMSGPDVGGDVGDPRRGGSSARSSSRPRSTREDTPVMEELSKRLGLSPSPAPETPRSVEQLRPRTKSMSEVSPVIERLTRQLNAIASGEASPTPKSQVQSRAQSPAVSSTASPRSPAVRSPPVNSFLSTPKAMAQQRMSSTGSTSSLSSSYSSRGSPSVTSTSTSGASGLSFLSSSSSDLYASSITSRSSSPAGSPRPSRSKEDFTFTTDSEREMATESEASITPIRSPAQRRSMIPVPTSRSSPTPSSMLNPYTTPRGGKRLSTIPGSTETTPTASKNNTPRTPGHGIGLGTPTSALGKERTRRVSEKGRESPLQAFTTPEALMSGRCDACERPLLVQDMRGPIVTIPYVEEEDGEEAGDGEVKAQRFHHACFRCGTCGDSFGELDGKANFVREGGKAVHISCASPMNVTKTMRPVKSSYPPKIPAPVFDRTSSVPRETALSNGRPSSGPSGLGGTRIPSLTKQRESARTSTANVPPIQATPPRSSSRPASNSLSSSTSASSASQCVPHASPSPATTPASTASASPTHSGRFACGGCQVTVFTMERGVVPGPQGGKWHVGCLVCGGKDWKAKLVEAKRWGRGPNEEGMAEIGCGKKLDSQARTDRIGRVYCRDCLGKLPADLRGPPSPLRGASTSNASSTGPLVPSHTGTTSVGGAGRIATHITGSSSKNVFNSSPASYEPATPGPRARSVSPIRRQITGGSGYLTSRGLSSSGSGIVAQMTGNMAPLVPQVTGGGLPITHAYGARPHSVIGHAPLKAQWTGSSTTSSTGGGPAQALSPQTTGGGLFVTRPRPKSVLGTRSALGGGHRSGIELVRQMTGGSEWRG